VEVESLEDLDRRLAAGARTMSGWHLQALDLAGRTESLRGVDVAGALFLGCRLGEDEEADLRARGAVVFPEVPGAPVDSYRPGLYTAAELYAAMLDGGHYRDTLDARAYAWSTLPRDRDASLAQALHDHAIDEALAAWVRGRRLVGVMGGHAEERGSPGYTAAAHLGHAVGAAYVVATGGGPGAMEAANLGGALAGRPADAVDAAVARLAAVPSFRPDVGAWARVALEVLGEVEDPRDSLGIPTWHYGHEPPNVFATAIAKYFRNAQREAILLEVCHAGIVFLPGVGGTVQEVFQDACENYYADASSVAPMVLVGRRYWTETLPAWPLLERLAGGRPMEDHVHLVDTIEEAAALVLG
jgi:predicted Rossmann-fold nucleotide-binding protein